MLLEFHLCLSSSKLVQERTDLEVHIEKGMHYGQKIVFQGEAASSIDHM
jgi:DnaJ-class molecular chaperone